MTMQAFLAGLYPPFDWSKWDPNLDWQPIPIGIDDPLLQMSNIDECIAYGESYSSTNSVKNPAARKLYENNKVRLSLEIAIRSINPLCPSLTILYNWEQKNVSFRNLVIKCLNLLERIFLILFHFNKFSRRIFGPWMP